MGRGRVTDTDTGAAALRRQLQQLARGHYVVAGIRGEKGAERLRTEGGGEDGGPRHGVADPKALSLVEIAAVNEFGSRDGRIPERSFMRSTFDRERARYLRILTKSIGQVVDGTATIEIELERLGERVVGNIQETIDVFTDPPNAQRTIDAKGSSAPLRDSGRLKQSISSELRRK